MLPLLNSSGRCFRHPGSEQIFGIYGETFIVYFVCAIKVSLFLCINPHASDRGLEQSRRPCGKHRSFT